MKHLTPQRRAMFLSYVRSSLVALGALVATGTPTWTNLWQAFLVAFLAPVLRWADPTDPAFGRGA